MVYSWLVSSFDETNFTIYCFERNLRVRSRGLRTILKNTFLRYAVKITLFVRSLCLAFNGKYSSWSDRSEISYQWYLMRPNFRFSRHFVLGPTQPFKRLIWIFF